ncbi:larval cuticle protein LCP-17-like [Penaeus monodon]|uniref:larval cuticle protein LCP-17-like n=1 Tax=Penaeus monodon TaxID=6687 RepID=UPI0018A6ED27|nr:larval cuticle protein LCP-17-like [Penaeus monodon]
MKAIVLAMFVAVALADRPSFSYDAPSSHPSAPVRLVEIIRDDRVHPAADGSYTFDVETEDGIVRHEAGGPGGAQQGSVSFTFPDGQVFDLQFVADANGYQLSRPTYLWLLPSLTLFPPTPSSRSSEVVLSMKLAPAENCTVNLWQMLKHKSLFRFQAYTPIDLTEVKDILDMCHSS